VYLSPRENRSLNESLDGGNFGGIGVYIFQLRDKRVVLQPIEDMPAAHAGMTIGEVVTRVDATPIAGLAMDRVEQMIRGEVGTTVRLDTYPFKAPKSHKSYSIVRRKIQVPTVHAEIKDGYEYIRLADFGTTSADEVKKALLDGRAHDVRGYILDLRNNGGGLVDAAVKISSYFVPSGTIVSTISRDGDRVDDDALGTQISGLKPLVILVNKYTASASEITSGALQDYHLATLVGTTTFGKGVVQSIYQWPDGGALKITTQRYVTPMGRDIQHRGIVPDIVVNQNADDPSLIGTARDKQLRAAEARLAQLAR
ncbi:MAG: S41 family peptidase, partial [Candidatus Eremiobacteraeota bacterium]|nr:S41 family peptidase [Candidatus Eremiobacteraeota bacterium]